jgi:hypothetical protein
MRRQDIQRNQEFMEQIKTIVDSAPPEQDKREGYVIEHRLWLERTGVDQANCQRIEESVRRILGLPDRDDA